VGIATNSPSTFSNYTNVTLQGGSAGVNLDFKDSGGNRTHAIVSTSTEFIVETGNTDPLIFKTNNSEALRIDSSGNVGLATSDISGFGGTYKGLDVAYKGSGLAGRTDNPTFDMRSNLFYDGSNYKYGEGSTTAGILSVGGAQLIFSNAPSGTAGATATVTERMRISSDGTVGIGNSTSSSFSSSANNLVVGSGSGSEGITIFGGAESNIFFSDGTGAPSIGRIEYSHLAEDMKFYVNNTQSLNITGGKVDVVGTLDIEEVYEKVATNTGTSGTLTFNTNQYAVEYYTANQTANRTINFSAVNSNLAVGQSLTCAVLLTQGSTAYYLNAYQVDGSSVTPKWQGGTAPTGGNASSIDAYSFTIIKTADATFTVLASITQFA